MQVAFRVDASATIGLGHLQRCLALAQALTAYGATVLFVTRDLGLDSSARIASFGFAVHTLPAPISGNELKARNTQPPHFGWAGVSDTQDTTDTIAALQVGGGTSPDWVVVDHYAFDANWHKAVAQALGARIAVIDDLADRPLKADLLIDHNLAEPDHRSKYSGLLDDSRILLGGPRFALLSPAYAAAPRCHVHDTVRSIGIFLGGTDPTGLSERVLIACRDHAHFAGPIELVTSRANPLHTALVAVAERYSDTTVSLDLPDLTSFFARHDLHVGAGGGATWERCCVGAPTLALVAAPNQLAVVPQLERRGAAAALPVGEEQSAQAIGRAIRDLLANASRRRGLSERARALVDGLGARRVAAHITAKTMRVRRASDADAALMYDWRNDVAIRSVSRANGVIAPDDHRRWLAGTLADRRRLLMVGELGTVPVGVIRFDRLEDENAEVSLYVDPALNGLGLGTELLRAGEVAACIWSGVALRFNAAVLEGNSGSRRLFESAGYRFTDDRGEKSAVDAPQSMR